MSDNSRPAILDGWIPEPEYCQQLGITVRTARNHRQRGEAPPHVKIGTHIFYDVEATRETLKARAIQPVRVSRKRAA